MAAVAVGGHRQPDREDGWVTLIDTAMAAIVLQVTPRWIRDLVAQGVLTNHGNARRIRLDLREVSAHAARRHAKD